VITEVYSANTSIQLLRKEVSVWPQYISSDSTVKVTVEKGSGSGVYKPGDIVSIAPDKSYEQGDFVFYKWEGNIEYLSTPFKGPQTFRVLLDDLHFEAMFKELFDVVVTKGTGSGKYALEDVVTITANTAQAGYHFKNWGGDAFLLSDATKSTQSFSMPGNDVSLSAVFEKDEEPTVPVGWTKIVDYGDDGYEETGTAWVSYPFSPANNQEYRYLSHGGTNQPRKGKAIWSITIPDSGKYELTVSFRKTENRTKAADYYFTDGNGPNYHKTYSQNGDGTMAWVTIGTFYWKKGDTSTITLDGTDSNDSDEADAMKWVYKGL